MFFSVVTEGLSSLRHAVYDYVDGYSCYQCEKFERYSMRGSQHEEGSIAKTTDLIYGDFDGGSAADADDDMLVLLRMCFVMTVVAKM